MIEDVFELAREIACSELHDLDAAVKQVRANKKIVVQMSSIETKDEIGKFPAKFASRVHEMLCDKPCTPEQIPSQCEFCQTCYFSAPTHHVDDITCPNCNTYAQCDWFAEFILVKFHEAMCKQSDNDNIPATVRKS
jgi:hypothetical protein